MQAKVNGFRVELSIGYYGETIKEFIVVLAEFANDDETNVFGLAYNAARLSYPVGTIDCVTHQKNNWCPTGQKGDPEGATRWVN